eukprot:EG_transcript_133
MNDEIANLDDIELVLVSKAGLEELRSQHEAFHFGVNTVLQALESMKKPTPAQIQLATERLQREVFRFTALLPALAKRLDFQTAVLENPFVVVKGETGSGKSTQLPQYLADMPQLSDLPIVCTQPRKVAAITLATRVAFEFGAGKEGPKLGLLVGYKVGGQQRLGPRSRILYVTEGTLLQQLLDARENRAGPLDWRAVGELLSKKYAAIVVDEAHERSTNTDILLGLLKNAVLLGGATVKVVVTSATLDTGLFTAFFGGCPLVTIPGRMFPVAVRYLPVINLDEAPDPRTQVVQCVLDILETTDTASGDILAFVTGQLEVETCVQRLQDQAKRSGMAASVDVLGLYGKQLPEDQAKTLQPAKPGFRKVIFSTNVAETSVTIDGVRHVVDCGLTKESTYDQRRKLSLLETRAICRSSADQRKGRAGRTSPGTCYRLYAEDAYQQMQPSQSPELLRSPLQLVLVNLYQLGLNPMASDFPWIQAPDHAAMEQAAQDLDLFDAVENVNMEHGEGWPALTKFGRLCAAVQMDPQLLRCVYHGALQGLAQTACKLGGLLTVSSNVFWRGGSEAQKKDADDKKARFATPCGDVVALLNVFNEWEAVGRKTNNSLAGPSEPDTDAAAMHEDAEAQGGPDAVALTTAAGTHPAAPRALEEAEEGESEGDESDRASSSHSTLSQGEADDGRGRARKSARPQEPKGRKRAAEQRQWCQEHCINHKSLCIAESTKRDVERALRKAQLWNVANEGRGTEEDVRKMVLAGYFTNLATRHDNLQNFYSPYNNQMARLDCRSVLTYQDCPFSWVAYQQVVKLQYPFLQTITPFLSLELEWLQEVAGKFARLHLPDLQKHEVHCETIAGLPKATLRAMVGKGREAIQRLERDLDVSLDVQFENGVVLIYGRWGRVEAAKGLLNATAEDFRAQLLDEVHIETFAGRCRAVYGAGCVVQRMLIDKESLVAYLDNLPPAVTAQEVSDWICQAIQVEVPPSRISLRMERPGAAGRNGAARAAGDTAQLATVRFQTPGETDTACTQLQDSVFNGHHIAIRPAEAEVKVGATATVVTGKVILSWSAGKSKGRAQVFLSYTAANALIDFAIPAKGSLTLQNSRSQKATVSIRARKDWKMWCPALHAQVVLHYTLEKFRFVSPTVQQWDLKGKPVPPNAGLQDVPFVVTVSELPAHWDEVDVEQAMARLLGVAWGGKVMVERQDMQLGDPSGFSEDDDGSFLGQTAKLWSLISGSAVDDPNQPDLQTSSQLGSHRAGFILRYTSLQATEECFSSVCRRLREQTRDGQVLFNGQSLRAHQEFTLSASMHIALYDIFRENLAAMVEAWQRTGLQVTIKQPANPGPHARVSISANSQDLAATHHAEQRIRQLLQGSRFTHDNLSLFFTREGSLALQGVAKRLKGKAHIHWHAPTQVVRVYGPAAGQHEAQAALATAVQQLVHLQPERIPIPGGPRGRQAARRMLRDLRSIPGIEAVFIQGSTMIVSGTTDARAKVSVRLDHIVGKTKAKAGGPGGPECVICMCEAEDGYVLQACGHLGCKDCLRNQFGTEPPFRCVACDIALVWNDIVAVAKPAELELAKRKAREAYLNESPTHKPCLTPDCEGVRLCPVTDQKFSCDACGHTYCPTCTEATQQEQAADHVGTPCPVHRQRVAQGARELRQRVAEALLPRRPCCGQPVVFGVWDGCAAVACLKDARGCGKHFCGVCLAHVDDSDVHPHVKT